MAALTTEASNKVWQKVKNALTVNVASAAGANPATQNAFQELRKYLSQQTRNVDLQFAPIDGTLAVTADSVLASGALTVYAIYLYKLGSVETVFKGSNHATVAGSDGTQDIAIAGTVAGDVYLIYPNGRAETLGLTVAAFTTRTGSSRVLAANIMSGFAILGA